MHSLVGLHAVHRVREPGEWRADRSGGMAPLSDLVTVGTAKGTVITVSPTLRGRILWLCAVVDLRHGLWWWLGRSLIRHRRPSVSAVKAASSSTHVDKNTGKEQEGHGPDNDTGDLSATQAVMVVVDDSSGARAAGRLGVI